MKRWIFSMFTPVFRYFRNHSNILLIISNLKHFYYYYLLSMLKTVELFNIFVKTMILLSLDFLMNRKFNRTELILEINTCTCKCIFTVNLDQFNASVQNKSEPKLLNTIGNKPAFCTGIIFSNWNFVYNQLIISVIKILKYHHDTLMSAKLLKVPLGL